MVCWMAISFCSANSFLFTTSTCLFPFGMVDKWFGWYRGWVIRMMCHIFFPTDSRHRPTDLIPTTEGRGLVLRSINSCRLTLISCRFQIGFSHDPNEVYLLWIPLALTLEQSQCLGFPTRCPLTVLYWANKLLHTQSIYIDGCSLLCGL